MNPRLPATAGWQTQNSCWKVFTFFKNFIYRMSKMTFDVQFTICPPRHFVFTDGRRTALSNEGCSAGTVWSTIQSSHVLSQTECNKWWILLLIHCLALSKQTGKGAQFSDNSTKDPKGCSAHYTPLNHQARYIWTLVAFSQVSGYWSAIW
jgi:hypothetical protein